MQQKEEEDEEFDLFKGLENLNLITEEETFDSSELELCILNDETYKKESELLKNEEFKRAVELTNWMVDCDFESIITKSNVFITIFKPLLENEEEEMKKKNNNERLISDYLNVIQQRIKKYGCEMEVFVLAICFLQSFVQANYTGPPLSQKIPYPFPIFSNFEEEGKKDNYYLTKLEADAKVEFKKK